MPRLRYPMNAIAIIFIASIALQSLAMNPSINIYDEGLILVGAQRILAGEIPYRDFWTMYAPGQFYLVATLFKFTGEHALVGRVYEFVIRGAMLGLTFALMHPFVSRRTNWISTLAVSILLISNWSYLFPIFPALAFTLAAAICVGSYIIQPRMSPALGAGLLSGCCAIFRHDIGFATSIACGAGIAASHILSDSRDPVSKRARAAIASNIALAAGALAIVLPIIALLAWRIPVADLYQSLISIPLFIYPKVRSLPFPPLMQSLEIGLPGLRQLIVYIPIIAVIYSITPIIFSIILKSRTAQTKQISFSIFLAITTCGLFFKGLVSVSPEHMVISEITSILLMASLTRLDFFYYNIGRATFVMTTLVVALPIFAYLELARSQVISNISSGGLADLCINSELPKLRCMKTSRDDIDAIRIISAMTGDGERIYAGAGRHDKLFANNISLYFLTSRLPATKWHDLHPGVETTSAIQTQMIENLEAHKPRLIVIDTTFDGAQEPNDSQKSENVFLLDEYISKNYIETSRLNSRAFLERRSKTE